MRMKSAESPPRMTAVSHRTMLATRHASGSLPSSRSWTNTGTNAAEIALSATRLRTRFGTLKAIRNAPSAGLAAEEAGGHDLAHDARDARHGGRRPEHRRRRGQTPLLAHRRGSLSTRCYAPPARRQAGICVSIRREPVANSKQQAKRVRTAARQRLENLRYRTQIKTLFRRLDRGRRGGRLRAGRRDPPPAGRARRPGRRPARDPSQRRRPPQVACGADRQPDERLRVTRPSRISVTPAAWASANSV